MCCARNAPQNSAASIAAGSLSAERLRSGAYTFTPFCHSMWWKPQVYLPRLSVPIAKPKTSPFVICFAMVTSSAPLAGTLGLPSAPTRPASFMTFMFM